MIPAERAIQTMNSLGNAGKPFFFMIDFLMEKPVVLLMDELNLKEVAFQFPGFGTIEASRGLPRGISDSKKKSCVLLANPAASSGECARGIQSKLVSDSFIQTGKDYTEGRQLQPIIRHASYPADSYNRQFNQAVFEIRKGNSFLINLTCRTPVFTDYSLEELFRMANARYKLRYQDQFLCFSPETFVRIDNGIIASFPMKGTIDAGLADARKRILDNPKEKAEHSTMVDLIRNDLSIVATQVKVDRFRYIDELITDHGRLLQVSSEITGKLPDDYPAHIGDILFAMLPAGSVTGAPKKRTVQIIRETEMYERGYYTGVFGIFDGRTLDSAVMIRFIEKTADGLAYKSGGGITAFSNQQDEYEEMLKKIYVPVY